MSRQTSLLRKLVPFRVLGCGPVAQLSATAFGRYPHHFSLIMETLEETDTEPAPRMALAEAFQNLVHGQPQLKVREQFADAEMEARQLLTGGGGGNRWMSDPRYRLELLQLQTAAGFWRRQLSTAANPMLNCEFYVHHEVSTDLRVDQVISPYFHMMLDGAGRAKITDDINDLVAQVLLLERDLYGEHRFDKRNDRMHLTQSILLPTIDKNDDTLGIFDVPAIRDYGNFVVDISDKFDGRWRKIVVQCAEEEEPFPWSEPLSVTAIAGSTFTADARVLFDHTLVSRRTDKRLAVTTAKATFEFELPNKGPADHSWLGRMESYRTTPVTH
jgi:hypothetical protein